MVEERVFVFKGLFLFLEIEVEKKVVYIEILIVFSIRS